MTDKDFEDMVLSDAFWFAAAEALPWEEFKSLSRATQLRIGEAVQAEWREQFLAEQRRQHGARGAAIRNASTMSKEQIAKLCWQIEDRLNAARITKPMSKAQAAEKITPMVSAELGKEYKASYIRQLLLMRGKI